MPAETMADRIILGAGAAGLMAALSLAEEGASALLLEAGPSAGRKLLLTGGGRCNLSNLRADDFDVDHYYGQAAFLRPAFRRFGPRALRSYLSTRKFYLCEEDEGRLFPARGGAQELLSFLGASLRQRSIRFQADCRIQSLRRVAFRGRPGFQLDSPAQSFVCRQLILAPGGASYPRTGSDGALLDQLEALGLDVRPFRPALSALRIPDFPFAEHPGISFYAELRLAETGTASPRRGRKAFQGSLLITPQGLSGPPALNLSRWLLPNRTSRITLSFLPDQPREALLTELTALLQQEGRRELRHLALPGLPRNLRVPFLSHLGLSPEKQAAQLTADERRSIAGALLAFPLSASSFPFSAAMASCGGAALDGIDPRRMESKKIPGLFLAGEILDLDGECGGYNLQAAFATAYLAAKAAAADLDAAEA